MGGDSYVAVFVSSLFLNSLLNYRIKSCRGVRESVICACMHACMHVCSYPTAIVYLSKHMQYTMLGGE